jgi:hypothetical protein
MQVIFEVFQIIALLRSHHPVKSEVPEDSVGLKELLREYKDLFRSLLIYIIGEDKNSGQGKC